MTYDINIVSDAGSLPKPSVWVVIAAYNEAKMIGEVVRGVRQYESRVIVVDDCSRDATGLRATEAGAVVLRHPINRGQGAALRTGFAYALMQGADIVVTFDADGQHQAHEISSIVAPVASGEVQAALGSRFIGATESNVPAIRRLVLKAGILFTRALSGLNITDTHNGFRALSRSTLSMVRLSEDRMAHASEILHEIARNKISYCEVPVTIRYTDYSVSRGQSSLNAVRIATRMVVTTFFSK